MKNFLAIYTGSPTSPSVKRWEAMDEAARKKAEAEAMKSWGAWVEKNHSVIVDTGGPLGKTKKTDSEGVKDIKNLMTGYVIVQAESHDAAARLFLNHPHFSIFPGDAVEIMELLPIPGM